MPPSSSPLARAGAWLTHLLPVLRWAPAYARDWRRHIAGDLVAGLTVTAVAAPEAVSYAAIAGLPAAQGLYTGFLGPLAYALTGSSPQLIVGPTAIMCILTANAIPSTWNNGGVVEPPRAKEPSELRVQLAALLSLTVAALQLLFALFRLGGLVTLISTPVVAGFTSGSALLTASSQFSSLLGMPKCVGASGGSCTFYEAVAYVVQEHAEVNGNVAVMSLVCLALLFGFKFGPKLLLPHLPKPLRPAATLLSNLAPLVLVFITVPIVYAVGPKLEAWGLDPPKTIPTGLPPPQWPLDTSVTHTSTPSADYGGLVAAAFPLAVIGYMGAVTIAKTASRQNGPYPVDASQELWAQVAANTACALGQGLPVTGSFSRTAVNAGSGATTAVASLLTAAFMAISLETLAGTLSLVPSVARASIVIVAIAKMIELHLFASLWRTDKRDFLVFAATFFVTIFSTAAYGLASGVALQWLLALTRSAGDASQVRLFAWSQAAGRKGGAGARAALAAAEAEEEEDDENSSSSRLGPASTSAAAAGFAWEELSGGGTEARGLGRGINDAAGAGASSMPAPAAPPHACVRLAFGPDLQFPSAERLRRHIDEAVAVYGPSALMLDGRSLASADSTGAAALIEAAADAAALSRCGLVAFGLSRGVLEVVLAAAAARGPGAKSCSLFSPADLRLEGSSGRIAAAGDLLLARTEADARAAAMEICALRQQGRGEGGATPLQEVVAGGKQSNSDSNSSSHVPLLDGEEGVDAADGAAASAPSSSSVRGSIPGVPLSPRVRETQIARRSRLPHSRVRSGGDSAGTEAEDGQGAGADAWESVVLAGSTGVVVAGGGAGAVARAGASVLQAGREALALLDDSRPLLAFQRGRGGEAGKA
jgi:sulfate permease, SulP family